MTLTSFRNELAKIMKQYLLYLLLYKYHDMKIGLQIDDILNIVKRIN